MQERRNMKHRSVMAAAEEEEEDDFFGRLPDDIIIDIFDRVNDSKFLTDHCLLLNKRIASLIRLVSSVSIKIHSDPFATFPMTLTRLCLHYKLTIPSQDFAIEVHCMGDLLLEELACLCISKAQEEWQFFSKVKSAVCEYTKLIKPSLNGELMRWMAEYSSGSVDTEVIKSCAFFGPIDIMDTVLAWFARLFEYAFTFYPMVAQFAQDHESLRDILVSVGSGKGWIHAEEDAIMKMRHYGSADNFNDLMKMIVIEGVCMKLKMWRVPVPNESNVYGFFVGSSIPDNIDQAVKVATRRFWGDCSYWAGYDDDVIQAGFARNFGELVETKSCDYEFIWRANTWGNDDQF